MTPCVDISKTRSFVKSWISACLGEGFAIECRLSCRPSTSMKTSRLPPAVWPLLAVLLLGAFTQTRAAESSPPGQAEHAAAAQQHPAAPEEQTFSLDFPGGSIADLLQAIEKVTGQAPNVIVSKNEANVSIPAFKVGGITFSTLARALTAAGAGVWMQNSSNSWAVLTANRSPQSPENRSVSVYSIASLLKTHTVTDIVAAIQLALEMAPSTDAPKAVIRYHKETSLLLLSGTQEQIGLATRVLNALGSQDSAPSGQRAVPGAPSSAGVQQP